MSSKVPSKAVLYLSTTPLLTNLLGSTASLTHALTSETSILTEGALRWFLIATMLLSLPSSVYHLHRARHDRLLLFLLVPLVNAALSTGLFLVMFRSGFPLYNAFVTHLVSGSTLFVSAGSLVWLLACGVWLWFAQLDTVTC